MKARYRYPQNGHEYERKRADCYINPTDAYDVVKIEMTRDGTSVVLKGVPGAYNAAMFDLTIKQNPYKIDNPLVPPYRQRI